MLEISIIIPVRNQKQTLLAALNSLKRQIKKPRIFEIVICDDGSTDGTDEAIKKIRYPIFFKYFVNNPSLGRSANRNSGFERSTGQRLIFFDGDMVPDENFVDAMLKHERLDSVLLGDVKSPPGEELSHLDKYLYSRGRYAQTGGDIILPGRFFTSNNFTISRDNFNKVGGFDKAFEGWGGEDIDFGMRLEKMSIPIKNNAEAITYHHHKRTIKSLVDDFYSFGEQSFAYLINKHPEFLHQIPSHVLGLSPASGLSGLFYRMVERSMVNASALKIAEKTLSSFSKRKWPDYIYDYIFWGNLALGYKRGRK